MKKLVIELMNHGYSQDQAQMFIQECCDAFMNLIEKINKIPESYELTTLERKALEAKYVATDIEAVEKFVEFNDPEAVKNASED